LIFLQGAAPSDFDDEPPLLEELGINPEHIVQKTLSVLNPFRATEQSVLQDTDMAGPLVFCLAFGSFLLLSGKVHFSYIYGIGVLGCIAMYALLTLMTVDGTTLGAVVSVLGYCLLPMVGLSGVNVLLSLQGTYFLVFRCIDIYFVSFVCRIHGNSACWNDDRLVFIVSIKTVCLTSAYGASAPACCIPLCSSVRGVCSDYDILNCVFFLIRGNKFLRDKSIQISKPHDLYCQYYRHI
jgi:hypothetical protein